MFTFALGIGTLVTALAIHVHIVNVRAARLEHIVPPAPYFPRGSIWTQDVSHAPADPQSSDIIDWLADAGGWGRREDASRLQHSSLQADASTPNVPFRKGSQFYSPDSDNVKTFPLPADGSIEGQPGYQCDIDRE